MPTLSFQSAVVAGFVGNNAAGAAFALLGQELWPVPTVLYSNHPAGRGHSGEVVSAAHHRRIIAALEGNKLMARVGQVLSGFLGHADQADGVVTALAAARRSNPSVRYICDPVLGDTGPGLYVADTIGQAIRQVLVPASNVVTPNHFELTYLTGTPAQTDADVWIAAARLQAMGPQSVVVTSVVTADTPVDGIDTYLLERESAWVIRTPRIVTPAHGAGDLLSGILAAKLAAGARSTAAALSCAVSSVYGVLSATGPNPDLALSAARGEIAAPTQLFRAVPRRLS